AKALAVLDAAFHELRRLGDPAAGAVHDHGEVGGRFPTLASASFMYVRLAVVARVGAQRSAPTAPTASSPRLRITCSSVMTPLPMRGSFPLKPYSAYCLMNRTPCAATKTAQTASTLRLIWVR